MRNDVLLVLWWAAWVACLRGWCASCVAWVRWVECLRGWYAIITVIVIIEILSWRRKYWMFTFETKMKKCSKKIWAGDLKKEPDSKSRCCFILFEPVMPEYSICLNPNLSKCSSICATLWICFNMHKKWRA